MGDAAERQQSHFFRMSDTEPIACGYVTFVSNPIAHRGNSRPKTAPLFDNTRGAVGRCGLSRAVR